jgi:hypothetical protein
MMREQFEFGRVARDGDNEIYPRESSQHPKRHLLQQDWQLLPEIVPAYEMPQGESYYRLYLDVVRQTLLKILPKSLFDSYRATGVVSNEEKANYHNLLPFFCSTDTGEIPGDMSFYAISRYRTNSFKFFFEMISRWLVPGKRLDVLLIHAVDFTIPEICSDKYTLCEVVVRLVSKEDFQLIKSNLPILESEIRLGINSSYYAKRILEIRGLAANDKTALIQEYITNLVARHPEHFDQDLINEMQHVLVFCHDEFKANRCCDHLTRIIALTYLFRKWLISSIEKNPFKRYITIKLFRARIDMNKSPKKVLGVLIAINFIKENEVFEKTQLLKAIRHFVPDVEVVEGSFLSHRRGGEQICNLYFEIEKTSKTDFTVDEIIKLRRELPNELKNHIEQLVHPVFMPRNEEEILRNIMILSDQIKFNCDIPHTIITFDEQTHSELTFNVILVRLAETTKPSIQEEFETMQSPYEFIYDWSKVLGTIKKKLTKTATVFRLRFLKESFLRKDQTVDLYRARKAVATELERVLGDVRDYNGGMFTKQNELLDCARGLLGDKVLLHEYLFENLFFSLQPVVMRTILEAEALCELFQHLLELSNNEGDESGKIIRTPCFIYGVFRYKPEELFKKEALQKTIQQLNVQSFDLAHACIKIDNIWHLGFVYRCDQIDRQEQFCSQILEHTPEVNIIT